MNLRENLQAAIDQANPPGSMQTGHESVPCGLLRTILRKHPANEDVTEELRLLRKLRQAFSDMTIYDNAYNDPPESASREYATVEWVDLCKVQDIVEQLDNLGVAD